MIKTHKSENNYLFFLLSFWVLSSFLSFFIFNSYFSLALGSFFCLCLFFNSFNKISHITFINFSESRLIHILFIILLLGLLNFGYRTTEDLIANPVSYSRLNRIFSVAIVFIICVIHFLIKENINLPLTGIYSIIFIYGIISLFSSIYSPYKLLTVFKSFEIIVSVCCVSILFGFKPIGKSLDILKSLFNLTIFFIFLLLLTVVLGIIIFPDQTIIILSDNPFPYRVQGIIPTINPISIGMMSAILGISFIAKILYNPNKYYFIGLIFSISLLIMSYSRTNLISFSLAVLFLLLITKSYNRPVLLIFMIISILVIINFISTDTGKDYFYRVQTINEPVFSLLGPRKLIWENSLDYIKQSPLLGYGFSAGERQSVLSQIGYERFSAAENSYISLMLGTGLIGSIPFLMVLIITIKTILQFFFKYKNLLSPEWKEFNAIILSIFIIIICKSLTTTILIYHDYTFLIFLISIAYAEILRKLPKPNYGN